MLALILWQSSWVGVLSTSLGIVKRILSPGQESYHIQRRSASGNRSLFYRGQLPRVSVHNRFYHIGEVDGGSVLQICLTFSMFWAVLDL